MSRSGLMPSHWPTKRETRETLDQIAFYLDAGTTPKPLSHEAARARVVKPEPPEWGASWREQWLADRGMPTRDNKRLYWAQCVDAFARERNLTLTERLDLIIAVFKREGLL